MPVIRRGNDDAVNVLVVEQLSQFLCALGRARLRLRQNRHQVSSASGVHIADILELNCRQHCESGRQRAAAPARADQAKHDLVGPSVGGAGHLRTGRRRARDYR